MRQGKSHKGHKRGGNSGADQQSIANAQIDDVEQEHAQGYQKAGQQDPPVVQLHAQPHEYLIHHNVVLDDAHQSLPLEHGESKNGGHCQDARQAKSSIAQTRDIRLKEVSYYGVAFPYGYAKAQDEEQEVHYAGDEGICRCLHLLSRIQVQSKRGQAQKGDKRQGSKGLEHIIRLRNALPQLKGHCR